MARDVRLALRRIFHTPGFSFCVVFILGSGVGAVAAMSSVLHALAYQPLSIPQPQTLISVTSVDKEGLPRTTPVAAVDRLRSASLAADGWCAPSSTLDAIESGGRVVEASGELMSGDCLSVLRLSPVVGRWFTAEEAPLTGSAQPVMIVTHRLWQRLFGGAPDVLGRVVKIQNISAAVIGVMPESYVGFSQDLHADFILPFNAHRPTPNAARFLGRLKPGHAIEELNGHVQALWPSLLDAVLPPAPTRAQTLAEYRGNGEHFGYGSSVLRRLYEPTVTRLTWLAAALFALVCINVGGLMVSRLSGRAQELATMRALGAGPRRIARLLVIECAVLATAGIAIAVPIGYAVGGAFSALLPIGNLEWDLHTGPDAGLLALVVVACVIVAILFGSVPMAVAATSATKLRSDRTVSRATSRWGQSLLVAQVASAVVIVFAGGLLFRSFANLRGVDRGYVREGLLSLRLSANPAGYQDLDPTAYYPALLEQLASLPTVESAAMARYFGTINSRPFDQPVAFAGSAGAITTAMTEFVSPGFFATAGVPLLRGRDFGWTDRPDTAAVAVISESLARVLAPDGDVIGPAIRHGVLPGTSRLEIVGVVGNVSFGNFRDTGVRAIYLPAIQQRETTFATVHIRTSGTPMALAPQASEAISRMGREHVRSAHAEDVLFTNSIVAERMGVMVSGNAAAFALMISGIGLFALMSNAVHKRTREIGIRLAVGATPAAVSALIIREAMRLILIGLAAGLPMSVGAASLLSALLFGVTSTDAITLAGSAVALVAAGAVGAAGPTLRAVRVDPTTALRAE